MKYQIKLVLPLVLIAAFVASCTDPCSIPLERAPRLRILNAMVDQQTVRVILNNALVQDSLRYSPPVTYKPDIQGGYLTSFASGNPLPIGYGQNLVILSATGDTLLKQTIDLSDQRQTMILIGRGRQRFGGSPAPADALMLDDQEGSAVDGESVARYVHAMPDFETVDVYFSRSIEGRFPLTLKYGQVTGYRLLQDTLKNSDGSYKRDANNQLTILPVDGLTVTEGGKPDKVIIRIEQSFELKGLFSTVVIRGSTDPQGLEPLPSPVVLSDRDLGTAIFSITSIFLRFVNGSSDSIISLYTKGAVDAFVRNNAPGQEKVLCIPPDSITSYWSITRTYHGVANWYFGSTQTCDRNDTFYYHTYREDLRDLTRYTMAALQTSKLGVSPVTWDHKTIIDTMGSPSSSTHGRIRFVNLSPDASVTVSRPGKSDTTLTQGQIAYHDYEVGSSVIVNGVKINVNPAADDPKTVWFGAATSSDPLPYHVSND